VGMKPIIVSGRGPSVFSLEHGSSGMWLFADCANPDSQWGPDSLWIFRRKGTQALRTCSLRSPLTL
jgi:hypothetical protein